MVAPETHRKTGFLSTKYSSQLSPKAIILDTPMVTTTNFTVSAAPQRRSRYLNDAGIVSRVNKSWIVC